MAHICVVINQCWKTKRNRVRVSQGIFSTNFGMKIDQNTSFDTETVSTTLERRIKHQLGNNRIGYLCLISSKYNSIFYVNVSYHIPIFPMELRFHNTGLLLLGT